MRIRIEKNGEQGSGLKTRPVYDKVKRHNEYY